MVPFSRGRLLVFILCALFFFPVSPDKVPTVETYMSDCGWNMLVELPSIGLKKSQTPHFRGVNHSQAQLSPGLQWQHCVNPQNASESGAWSLTPLVSRKPDAMYVMYVGDLRCQSVGINLDCEERASPSISLSPTG